MPERCASLRARRIAPHAMRNAEDHPKGLPSRRTFMRRAGVAAAAARGAGIAALGLVSRTSAEATELGPLRPEDRRDRCFEIRTAMASVDRNLPMPDHLNNGDEERFATKIGNFSKGLPHNSLGEPFL